MDGLDLLFTCYDRQRPLGAARMKQVSLPQERVSHRSSYEPRRLKCQSKLIDFGVLIGTHLKF